MRKSSPAKRVFAAKKLQASLRQIAGSTGVSHTHVRNILCGRASSQWTDSQVRARVRETVVQVNRGNRRGPNRNRWTVSAEEIRHLWLTKAVWAKAWSDHVPCESRIKRLCPKASRQRTIRYTENEETKGKDLERLSQSQKFYC